MHLCNMLHNFLPYASKKLAAGNMLKCIPLVSIDTKVCNKGEITILPITEVDS